MSIPITRYVAISSGQAAGAAVRARDLILRIFTASPFIGPGEVLEFDRGAFDAGAIGARFGASAVEQRMAAQYFGYVSPRNTVPTRISFASYRAAQQGATVYGNTDYRAMSTIQGANAGAMAVTVAGAAPVTVGPVDLSAVLSLAATADAVEAAMVTAGIVGATVDYVGGRFVVQVPDFGDLAITSTVSGKNDLATLLGLTEAQGAFSVRGSAAMTPVECVQSSANLTDNFGSFVFAGGLSELLTAQVAAWNKAQNVKYQYHVGVTKAQGETMAAALSSYGGCGVTLTPDDGTQWPELLPCAILASTDYSQRAATQNFMFRQGPGLTAQVRDSVEADKWDALRVNYYGDTSSAGQRILFYQRGTLLGTPSDPSDMSTYANEQWLKDAAASQLLGLQLSLGRIPANDEGAGLIGNTVQDVIDRALLNGVISVGKKLTQAQRIYLTQATGDALAWQKVQSAGYILQVRIEPYTTVSGAVEYRAVYELFYAKDDAIRKIDGTHSLI